MTNAPVQVNRNVRDHKNLYFQDGFFHAVSEEFSRDSLTSVDFTSFAIVGNSIVKTGSLPKIVSGNAVDTVTFSSHRAYVSVGQRSVSSQKMDESLLAVVDLSQPESPVAMSPMNIAGDVRQFYGSDLGLVGLGSSIYRTGAGSPQLGRVSLFGEGGDEQDVLIFGADAGSVSSGAFWDDQVAAWDESNHLLLVPFVTYPERNSGGSSKNQLLLAQVGAGQVTDLATPEFSEEIQRSLSVDSDRILAFSESHVFLLKNRSGWGQETILDASLPSSIYEVLGSSYVLRRDDHQGDTTVITVAPRDDLFTREPKKDTLEIPMLPDTRIYFTQDLVLEVYGNAPDLKFRGWRLRKDGTLHEETDTTSFPGIYETITDGI